MTLLDEFPADGFIGSYLRYARRLTDAPDVYHVGCALAALSAAFAPRVAFEGAGGKPGLLNLWIGLVGPSRKTTAIDLLRPVLVDGPIAWTDVDRKSTERTFARFADQPRGIVLADDWAAVCKRIAQPAWEGGCSLLCSLFDGETMRRVTCGPKGEEAQVVETRVDRPRLTSLTGFRGGHKLPPSLESLTRRMLWLYGEPKRYRAASPFDDSRGADRLFAHLALLRRQSFDLRVQIARPVWKVWSRFSRTNCPMIPLHPLYSRLPGLLLRAAALDVLGRVGLVADPRLPVCVQADDVDRMIRVLGPAAVRGLQIAFGEAGE